MTLEEEIFKKSELDNNKLLEYGFIKKDNYLEYKKPIGRAISLYKSHAQLFQKILFGS